MWRLRKSAGEKGHIVSERASPVSWMLRCACGWSATQSRSQNALARAAKLHHAERAHYLVVLGDDAL